MRMVSALGEAQERLHHLTRTDPRVRHRAQALLLVAQGQSVSAVARLFATAGQCMRTWRERLLAEGRTGLLDRPRRGRSPKLGEDDLAFLRQALERSPQDYGLLVWLAGHDLEYASGPVIFQLAARKGEDAFAAFLDHLAHALPADEPAIVVLANVGYHKSHLLRERWRGFGDHLQPVFLPAYAPELNLIERLWRYLKGQLAGHRWWNDLAHLQQAT